MDVFCSLKPIHISWGEIKRKEAKHSSNAKPALDVGLICCGIGRGCPMRRIRVARLTRIPEGRGGQEQSRRKANVWTIAGASIRGEGGKPCPAENRLPATAGPHATAEGVDVVSRETASGAWLSGTCS